ncbi:MAG: segregation/condensation protein A [Phycisphaeraceae bacterium]|nr:segregation/condensation protein A [Phycisphaeraceae bacterium]MCW5762682.1 segregation/condensation protein A [Phycisphaeraceae bacterium]
MSSAYRVRLSAFEGPLDLLLYLVRKAEVEIADIPISTITEQYLSYLGDIDDRSIDIDTAGEFLVMAATLMEIKSRLVARASERDGAGTASANSDGDSPDAFDALDAADPRSELVRQLLEYKKYRDMADGLEARREAWLSRYPAAPAAASREHLLAAIDDLDGLDADELDLGELVAAFGRIVGSVNLARLGEHEIIADDTPIELFAADIVDALARAGGRLSLTRLLLGRTRSEMVGLFLGLLDLVRQQRVGVRQLDGAVSDGDRFELSLREDGTEAEPDGAEAETPLTDP